jgi:hypothetical protein
VRNHNGPACIANLYAIRTWIDDGPEPDWSEYNFTDDPALHGAPYYHPVGNPPTQLPRENLVATVLEWENVVHTPPLRPVHTRQATPYPVRALLALPWYGIGGVPPLEEMEGGVESVPVCGMATLTLGAPAVEYVEGHMKLEEEHESHAQKRRARRKRAKDSAKVLRRSMRLKEKEEPTFELPEVRAARVQEAKFDFNGASRRLRNALSHSYLISDSYPPHDDVESLLGIAAACGANEEEMVGMSGEAAVPPRTN